jgi:hypothetical protein
MYFRGEVYNSSFIYFKYYSTPPLLVKSFINNYLNTFLVTLCSWPSHSRGKVIYKSNYSTAAINLSLHEVLLRKVDLSSLPKPWDRLDLSPDNGLTYSSMLNVQLVWRLVTVRVAKA